jgi:VWFA-related protein
MLPVVLLASSATQSAAPQASPQTFRAGTQVVMLDLVAKDGKGRPVADLRLEDLQVFEDGQRCQVESFRLVRAPGRPAAATGVPSAPAATPAEGGPATPSQANLVVLLFDELPISMARAARQGALELLKQRFPPNTWFAVFKVYTAGTRALQTFTAEPKDLAAAVQAATLGDDAHRHAAEAPDAQGIAPPASPPGLAQRPPDVPNDLAAAIGPAVSAELSELSQRVQTYDSLYALMAVSRSLAPVRGRKSVIYFAVAREVPDLRHALYDDMVSVANRANVTIHTVDARGLTAARVGFHSAFDQAIGLYSAAGPTGGGRGSFTGTGERESTGPLMARADIRPGDFLEHVAGDTGGLAIARTNDLGAGLAEVVEELRQYYEIVYTPPNPAQDGRFRRIAVKVLRPGVRVRTRSGYYATPASTPSLAAFELPLMTALAQADPPRAFEHEAGLLQFAPRGAERETVFLAQVPVSAVGIARDPAAGTYRAHLALLALIKDAAGRAVARLSQDWPVDGTLDPAGRPRETNFVFRRLLPLPPGRYTVEVALQDRQTGGISTSRSAADIEASAGSLALGSLTVVRAVQPADPAARPDPLTVGGVTVQPELGTPVLRPGTREVPLLLPVFAPAGAAPELRVELRRGSEGLKTLAPKMPAPDAEGRLAWIGGISVGSLPPGRYEVVATVRSCADTAESRTSFEIRPQAELERAAGLPAPPVPAELVPVLERAGRYVLEYEQTFKDLAAVEAYTQSTQGLGDLPAISRSVEGAVPAEPLALLCPGSSWCQRSTKADAVFVRSSGGGWSSFRDVYELDGQKVREREPRLERLFSGLPAADAERQARGLLEDSDSRYGIGPCMRNLNEPTLGLAILHPTNQSRFNWKQAGKRRVENVDAVEVAFEEIARPTLLSQSDGEPLPAAGRLWIDPARGTLVRSEVEFRFAPRWARAFVTVEYRLEPALGIWVPAERREQYEDLTGGQPMFGRPTKATAKFSGFHRFERAAGAVVAAAALSPELVQALRRAGDYVAEYERSFSDLVVEETYKQSVSPRPEQAPGAVPVGWFRSRTTRAELVFVRLAGPFPWASYRDVFEVDGHKLREQDQRLVKLLTNPQPDAHEKARKLLEASAAYNIGPVKRTVNLPTLPLMFLLLDNQPRFEFRLGERKTIAATETVELLFRETSRPTLVKGPGGADLSTTGRFWVSPTRGTVVRSEVEFDFGPEAEARVSTDYRPEPTLAMWVPSEMCEEYADVKGAKVRTFSNRFKGVAQYGEFRRFIVTAEEGEAVPWP